MTRQPRVSGAGLALLAAAALLAWKPVPAAACSAPVFRYALENWPPDAYEAVVVHRGPLTEEQRRLVAELGFDDQPARDSANVVVRLVDLDGEVTAEDRALFEAQQDAALPWLLVRYPAAKRARNFADVWAGPFTENNADRLIDSPVRQKIARRILDGHSVVWVFLDSGNAARDEAKFALLETELKRLEGTLKLPEIDPADIASGEISDAVLNLKPRFSAVRVTPETEAEAEELFAAMLRNSEEDGTPESLSAFAGEPLAFPIFGRGRALFAYVGDGINTNMIEDGCGQLIEKCLCTRKADFAGTDLVMAVDWNALIEVSETADRELPPLSGPAAFLDSSASGGRKPPGETPSTAADPSQKKNAGDKPAGDSPNETPAQAAASTSTTSSPPGYSTTLFILPVLLVGLVIVVAVASALSGRKEGH